MKYIGNILKISIIMLILIVCFGSVYASEDIDDDFEDADDEFSDSDEVDLDDEDDYEDELDEISDENESDCQYDDYEYLKYKITSYLTKYGNASDENWTESGEFLEEYEIYLADPSNYTLNKSSQGYETYLKIFDSVTSTFNDYNLTQNQTDYLKFMIIYYLNHYGNVSDNYTWNESDDFSKFEPSVMMYVLSDSFTGHASAPKTNLSYSCLKLNNILTNFSDNPVNSTVNSDDMNITVSNDSSEWMNIFLIILVVILLVFVII